jgi:uncharacterized protein (TIGR02246 family)
MRLLIALLSTIPFTTSCVASPPPLSDDDRRAVVEDVRAAVGQLRAAMNDADADRVLSFYADGPDLVYVGCTEFHFGEAYRNIATLYYRPSRGVTFEQEIVQVKVLGPATAVVSMRGSSSAAPYLFWTQVWVREPDGGWVVTNAHQSWPGCDEPRAGHPGTSMPDSAGLLRDIG